MKKFLLLYFFSVLGYSYSTAQNIHGQTAPVSVQSLLSNQALVGQTNTSPFQTQVAALPYSYYDGSLSTFNWTVGAFYNPYIMAALGERISLPGSNGVVDSVRITFGSVITPDSILVSLFPDTLFQTSDGRFFHLINIFDPNIQPYAQVYVKKTDIVSGGPTSIAFDHVAVPKDFFVLCFGALNAAQSTFLPYEVLGDKEATRTLTTDNSHSGFVAVVIPSQQTVASLLDSVFTANGETEPMFSNLLVTAYVEAGSDGVQPVGYHSNTSLKSFPNPATDNITFVTENGITTGSLSLYDVSGRSVWSGSIDGVRQLDVTQLPSGIYRVVYHSGELSVVKTVSIVH